MLCITNVTVTNDRLTVQLADGRRTSVPLAWYPRLVHAMADERDNRELQAAYDMAQALRRADAIQVEAPAEALAFRERAAGYMVDDE